MSELQDAIDRETVLNIEAAINYYHPELVQPYLDTVEAARLVANAQQFMRPHQTQLNGDLRAALGRGTLAPWERDIRALLDICAALTPGDTE
jgi:hypothetical protein